MGRHLDGRHPSRLDGQLAQIMLDIIGQRLGIGGTSRSAAPDVIVELGNLVGNAVGHVRAGGNAGVGTEDDASGEGDGDDGGSRGDFAGTEVAGFGRLAVVGAAHCGRGVMVVGEGAHLGLVANRSGPMVSQRRNGTEGCGDESCVACRVLGWPGFVPDFRHLRDQSMLDFSTSRADERGRGGRGRW